MASEEEGPVVYGLRRYTPAEPQAGEESMETTLSSSPIEGQAPPGPSEVVSSGSPSSPTQVLKGSREVSPSHSYGSVNSYDVVSACYSS